MVIFFVYSDEEMTKLPESDDDESSQAALKFIALNSFLVMVVLIAVSLILFEIFRRLCTLVHMADVVSTEDDEPSNLSSRRVNKQSRMDTYGGISLSKMSPPRPQVLMHLGNLT